MADNKKKRDPQFTTPIGVFQYPRLNEPDYGTDKYPAPEGQYKVNLILTKNDPQVQSFLANLKPYHDAAVAEAHDLFKQLPVVTRKKLEKLSIHPLFDDVYDKETEEPTGEIVMKFKLKASGVYKSGQNQGKKWNAFPLLFDSFGRRIAADSCSIWGGTKGRVSFSAGAMFVAGIGLGGLSTRLIGAQIVELVSKGERSAESLGFGAVEGGFVADNTQPTSGDTAKELDDSIEF